MVCMISCGIAAILIAGMLYTSYMAERTQLTQNFMKILNPKQQNIYKRIVKERRNIYFAGFILGLILSLIVIWWNWTSSKKLTRMSLLCLIGGITMVTNYFYYILAPKTNWMIMHIHGEDQKQAWLKVYKHMQRNYHVGLLLGIVGVVFIGNMFCK